MVTGGHYNQNEIHDLYPARDGQVSSEFHIVPMSTLTYRIINALQLDIFPKPLTLKDEIKSFHNLLNPCWMAAGQLHKHLESNDFRQFWSIFSCGVGMFGNYNEICNYLFQKDGHNFESYLK